MTEIIDINYRPKSYFRPQNLEAYLISQIKSAVVREELERLDVTSLFAKFENGQIHYRVVDEYEGDTLTGTSEMTSDKPLTLGEMADFFLGAWSLVDVLEMNFEADVNRQIGVLS